MTVIIKPRPQPEPPAPILHAATIGDVLHEHNIDNPRNLGILLYLHVSGGFSYGSMLSAQGVQRRLDQLIIALGDLRDRVSEG